jgi:hypothetical protein
MTGRALILIIIAGIFAACSNGNKPENLDALRNESAKQMTTIQWIDSVRNFGKINEGQKLSVSFRFKNTGDKPLVIQSVHPSCGCTVADYPREPIAPGEEGEITGEFNSEGRQGENHKEITVYTNTATHTHNLVFDVNVVAKPGQQQAATN